MRNFLFFIFFTVIYSCINEEKKIQTNNLKSKFKSDKNSINIVKYQEFFFEVIEGVEIVGKYKTKISISKNSFLNYNGGVILKLIEAYDYVSFYENNLQTITDKQEILESKGMIYFNAFDTLGRELTLKKPIKFNFRNKHSEDYNLYTLNKIDKSLWTLDNSQSKPKKVKKHKKIIVGYEKETFEDGSVVKRPVYYDSILVNDVSTLEYFTTLGFGWFNLDRKVKDFETRDVTITNSQEINSYYLISKSKKIFLKPTEIRENIINFSSIPYSINFVLIGIKRLKENEIIFFSKEINQEKNIDLTNSSYKTVSSKKFEDYLNSLSNIGNVSI